MGPGSRPLRGLGRDDSRVPLGKSCRARQFCAGVRCAAIALTHWSSRLSTMARGLRRPRLNVRPR